MTNNEAKFILSAYRPGGRDASDPAMTQALAQAKSDPALGAWFEREQQHAAAVAAKLAEIAPPAGLREAILAGARMSERDGMSDTENSAGPTTKTKEMTRARWAQPVWLAAAAVLAVLLSLAAWRMVPVRGDSFAEFAVNFVDKGFRLQKRGADVAELKTWLREQHGPLPEALPAKFAELRALGCRTLSFKGQDVSLVCFERGGREFHVFVARRDETKSTMEAVPRFLDAGRTKLVAATWADAKNRYVLVSDAEADVVKRLL